MESDADRPAEQLRIVSQVDKFFVPLVRHDLLVHREHRLQNVAGGILSLDIRIVAGRADGLFGVYVPPDELLIPHTTLQVADTAAPVSEVAIP